MRTHLVTTITLADSTHRDLPVTRLADGTFEADGLGYVAATNANGRFSVDASQVHEAAPVRDAWTDGIDWES